MSDKTLAVDGRPVDVLSAIRSRTRPMHAHLESRMDLAQAFASRQAYAKLLSGYAAIYELFEERMESLPARTRQRLDWPSRRKLNLIDADLAALGAAGKRISGPVELPALEDTDSALGALYVVEGSCLGGQVLYRMLESSLSLKQATGASFFYGYGEQTGVVWKAFTALLRRDVRDHNRAAETAVAMFQTFEQTLVQAMA